jgi:hypothetical protein
MSALLTPPRAPRRGPGPPEPSRRSEPGAQQASLFDTVAPLRPAAPVPSAPPVPAAPPATAAPVDGPTLDDVITRAWEALSAQVAAACPLCGSELEPHGAAAGGRCGSCGSELD